MKGSLSIILFSGTDDKLTSLAILASGAAAMDRPVNIFLQYGGLDVFRADKITKDHGFTADSAHEVNVGARRHQGMHWSETLRMAKDIGEIHIDACSHSMEMLELTPDDLDPMVDDVSGIAGFVSKATDQLIFI